MLTPSIRVERAFTGMPLFPKQNSNSNSESTSETNSNSTKNNQIKFEDYVKICRERNLPETNKKLWEIINGNYIETQSFLSANLVVQTREILGNHGFFLPFFLCLTGLPGVGKSLALSFFIYHHSRQAFFTNSQEFYRQKSNWSENKNYQETIRTVDFLGFDDIGIEKETLEINQLLCERHDRGLLTILTSNLPPAEINNRYFDDRFRDRLKTQIREYKLKPFKIISEESMR